MIIPKIELKITNLELREAYMAIEFEIPEIPLTGEKLKTTKSYYSLLESVRVKLAKKVVSHKNKTKPFKLSLEYFEALCLLKTLEVVNRNRYAQNFFEKLDQKLA